MAKWVGIFFVAVGIGIYRYFMGSVGAIEMGVVGAISGAIGGVIGAMYDNYFGKYNHSILHHLDTIAGFFLRLLFGLFVALVVTIEMHTGLLKTVIFILITFGISLPLTYRMLKKKGQLMINKSNENHSSP